MKINFDNLRKTIYKEVSLIDSLGSLKEEAWYLQRNTAHGWHYGRTGGWHRFEQTCRAYALIGILVIIVTSAAMGGNIFTWIATTVWVLSILYLIIYVRFLNKTALKYLRDRILEVEGVIEQKMLNLKELENAKKAANLYINTSSSASEQMPC